MTDKELDERINRLLDLRDEESSETDHPEIRNGAKFINDVNAKKRALVKQLIKQYAASELEAVKATATHWGNGTPLVDPADIDNRIAALTQQESKQ